MVPCARSTQPKAWVPPVSPRIAISAFAGSGAMPRSVIRMSLLASVLASPLIGLLFGMQGPAIATLALTLLLGTPVLSLLGAVGAALTLGLRSGAALVFLLVLPLTVPALIFGTGAVVAVDSGLSAQAHFSLLGALLIFTLLGAPLAAALALRISLD